MKLEKDRLVAKVDSLQISLNQLTEETNGTEKVDLNKSTKKDISTIEDKAKSSNKNPALLMTGVPSAIPQKDRFNPHH